MRKDKKRKEYNINTFSKIWVDRNMKFSWICIFLSFGLAFIGRTDIAETLACTIVVNIIGVFSGYFAKSFFETREEKRHELREKELGLLKSAEENTCNNTSFYDQTEEFQMDIDEDADI